ncbi:MAG: flagellar hook-basal body complex protein FliE [Bacillota bacterium]|jgi:flagellar hook-basal body complex protein FliE
MLVRPVSTPVVGQSACNSIKNNTTLNSKDASFNQVFQQISSAVQNLDQELLASQIDLVTGNARDMHTAVLAAEKASLTLDLIVSVRNKAIEAYQEIMRMPL